MSKYLFVAATAAVLFVQPAFAAMDCGGMLDRHTGSIMKMSQATPEKRAALQRMALRGYDHCVAGDEKGATLMFDMIATTANSK